LSSTNRRLKSAVENEIPRSGLTNGAHFLSCRARAARDRKAPQDGTFAILDYKDRKNRKPGGKQGEGWGAFVAAKLTLEAAILKGRGL